MGDLVPFCRKSRRFIKRHCADDARITVLDGSVRSSKTFTMIPKLLFRVLPELGHLGHGIITGVSKLTIKRNILNDLFDFVGEGNYEYNSTSGELDLMGYKIQVVGAKDEGSEKYIRGGTFAWAYGDELSLMPESFFKQLLNRMSVPGARVYGTTNPDNPFHYLNVEYLTDPDKLASRMVEVIHYNLDDNLSLTEDYKKFIRNAYTGVFYQRYILGKWVIAEGAIYKDCLTDDLKFSDDQIPPGLLYDGYVSRYILVDYGTTNPMVFLDVYDDGTTMWVLREYYWDSKREGSQKTDAQYADDLQAFMGERYAEVILDPSAASFAAELLTRGIIVTDADNEVLDGIRMTSSMMAQKHIRIHESCTNTWNELGTYSWDTKKSDKGKEEPIKAHDHAPDALRYGVKTKVYPWRLAE